MEWPSDPAASVRFCFCGTLALSLLSSSASRITFFHLRSRYIVGVGENRSLKSGFYTNTFADVAVPAWPLSLLPGTGGWPLLSRTLYERSIRTHLLELSLLAAAVAPTGTPAAALLAVALGTYLLLFGQRMAQMFGMVSGSKDCLAAWSLLLLLASELDGTGAARSLQVLMALAYGVPGFTKFLLPYLAGHGALAWLNGRTLQCIMLERTVLYDNHLAGRLAAALDGRLCVLGSILAVAFENAFFAL